MNKMPMLSCSFWCDLIHTSLCYKSGHILLSDLSQAQLFNEDRPLCAEVFLLSIESDPSRATHSDQNNIGNGESGHTLFCYFNLTKMLNKLASVVGLLNILVGLQQHIKVCTGPPGGGGRRGSESTQLADHFHVKSCEQFDARQAVDDFRRFDRRKFQKRRNTRRLFCHPFQMPLDGVAIHRMEVAHFVSLLGKML